MVPLALPVNSQTLSGLTSSQRVVNAPPPNVQQMRQTAAAASKLFQRTKMLTDRAKEHQRQQQGGGGGGVAMNLIGPPPVHMTTQQTNIRKSLLERDQLLILQEASEVKSLDQLNKAVNGALDIITRVIKSLNMAVWMKPRRTIPGVRDARGRLGPPTKVSDTEHIMAMTGYVIALEAVKLALQYLKQEMGSSLSLWVEKIRQAQEAAPPGVRVTMDGQALEVIMLHRENAPFRKFYGAIMTMYSDGNVSAMEIFQNGLVYGTETMYTAFLGAPTAGQMLVARETISRAMVLAKNSPGGIHRVRALAGLPDVSATAGGKAAVDRPSTKEALINELAYQLGEPTREHWRARAEAIAAFEMWTSNLTGKIDEVNEIGKWMDAGAAIQLNSDKIRKRRMKMAQGSQEEEGALPVIQDELDAFIWRMVLFQRFKDYNATPEKLERELDRLGLDMSVPSVRKAVEENADLLADTYKAKLDRSAYGILSAAVGVGMAVAVASVTSIGAAGVVYFGFVNIIEGITRMNLIEAKDNLEKAIDAHQMEQEEEARQPTVQPQPPQAPLSLAEWGYGYYEESAPTNQLEGLPATADE
jgi:hypothetical protein